MPDTQSSEFLVLGGGIGGLAAALALARRDHDVRVLEQAPEFGEVGAGLQVAPNASRVLDALGVLDAVVRDAFFPRSLTLRDALTAQPITSVETSEAFLERYGYRYFVTHRADLHRALLEACADSGRVDLRAGRSVQDVGLRPDGADVHCADGDVFATRALIAADGVHSVTRRELLCDDVAAVDSGFVAHRGTVPIEALAPSGGLRDPDSMTIWVGPGLHLVQYPVRSGELCNQVAVFDTHRYAAPAGAGDAPGAQLDAAFAVACPEVARSVALMDHTKRWAMLDRPPARGWSQGPTTLLGDAAHPMLQYLAQGANQAIEDAAVLAASLANTPGDVEAGFTTYEQLRSPRTARVQTTARAFGDVLHIDGMGRTLRAELLGRRSPRDYDDMDWLWGYDALRAVEAWTTEDTR